MHTPRPLFFIGNKRSGTSQLVRLLNLHPRIFVAHEADIAWILFQYHHGRAFEAHKWDSDRGMRTMLEATGDLLRRDATPAQNFLAMQLRMMEKGNPWLPPQHKTDLLWLGDKKPQQQTDPELLAFVLEHFPEARFMHIVRHPLEVVESSDRFNKTADGDFWLGLSQQEKLERWAFHEEEVIKLRERMPERVCSLRYEDLCRQTRRELTRVFAFLEVDPDPAVLREAARQTRPLVRDLPKITCSNEVQRIAKSYGYDLDSPPGRVRALLNVAYWRVAKSLGA